MSQRINEEDNGEGESNDNGEGAVGKQMGKNGWNGDRQGKARGERKKRTRQRGEKDIRRTPNNSPHNREHSVAPPVPERIIHSGREERETEAGAGAQEGHRGESWMAIEFEWWCQR